jgi:hypothetical protein
MKTPPRFLRDDKGVVHAFLGSKVVDPAAVALDSECVMMCCESDDEGEFLGDDLAGEQCPFNKLTPTLDLPNCPGCAIKQEFWASEEDFQ